VDNYWKIVRYVVTNTRKVVLVLVDFQNKLLQCKLLDYILVGIPRIAIWGVAAKCVTLLSFDLHWKESEGADEDW